MKIFSQIRSSVFDTEKISELILSFIYPGKEYFTKRIIQIFNVECRPVKNSNSTKKGSICNYF